MSRDESALFGEGFSPFFYDHIDLLIPQGNMSPTILIKTSSNLADEYQSNAAENQMFSYVLYSEFISKAISLIPTQYAS